MGQPKRKASPRVRELLATKTQFSSMSKSKGKGTGNGLIPVLCSCAGWRGAHRSPFPAPRSPHPTAWHRQDL